MTNLIIDNCLLPTDKCKTLRQKYVSDKEQLDLAYNNLESEKFKAILQKINEAECSELVYFHEKEKSCILLGNLITYERKDLVFYDLYYYTHAGITCFIAKYGNRVDEKYRSVFDLYTSGVWIPSEPLLKCYYLFCELINKSPMLSGIPIEDRHRNLKKFHSKLYDLYMLLHSLPISPFSALKDFDYNYFHDFMVDSLDAETKNTKKYC